MIPKLPRAVLNGETFFVIPLDEISNYEFETEEQESLTLIEFMDKEYWLVKDFSSQPITKNKESKKSSRKTSVQSSCDSNSSSCTEHTYHSSCGSSSTCAGSYSSFCGEPTGGHC